MTGFDPKVASPFTGRSTAAALAYAVKEQVAGKASGFRGQDPDGQYPQTYAVFRFTPARSEDTGEIGINVQPDFDVDDESKSVKGAKVAAAA